MRRLYVSVTVIALLAVAFIAMGAKPTGESGRVISVLGVSQLGGQEVVVEVLALVPAGGKASDVAAAVLREQGARPFAHARLGGEGFTLTGLRWDAGELPVNQFYNPAKEPVNGADALALTHQTLNTVTTSTFAIGLAGPTTRCPSLVRQCSGPQVLDGFDDVGWLKLSGSTLGVTWFTTSGEREADMALNTRYDWINDFDVETVFLHENLHVAGLGHSDDPDSVMLPSYQGVDIDLADDDRDGLTFLYDDAVLGTVSGTVKDAVTQQLIDATDVTVVLEGTSLTDTTVTGSYAISSVPDPVTYTVTASANGYDSASIPLTVTGPTVADIELTLSGGTDEADGGGGFCPPGQARKNLC